MSEQDSFINEVNEAVRQDQLYGYLRRYGWIAALVIIALVGGAAWNEISKARTTAAAEALGDSLLSAMGQNDPVARAEALAEVEAEGVASSVAGLLTAAAQLEATENDAALTSLDGVAGNADADQIYRDIAMFKSALIDTGETRAQKLEALAQPGGALRLLAEEQLALDLLSSGDADAAIAAMRRILEDAEVTQSLRDRAQTLIVALGAPLDLGAPEAEQ